MKQHTTTICLTIITIAEMAFIGTLFSFGLWALYGLYKLENS